MNLELNFTSEIFNTDERADRHKCVVIQVQEGDLRVLLAEDEENRIKKLDDFRHVIKPNGSCHLKITIRINSSFKQTLNRK